MSTKQEIIISSIRDGKSIREISRETSLHRNTVKRQVIEFSEKKQATIASGQASEGEMITDFLIAPCYDSSTRKPRKVSPEIEEEVKSFYCIRTKNKYNIS